MYNDLICWSILGLEMSLFLFIPLSISFYGLRIRSYAYLSSLSIPALYLTIFFSTSYYIVDQHQAVDRHDRRQFVNVMHAALFMPFRIFDRYYNHCSKWTNQLGAPLPPNPFL